MSNSDEEDETNIINSTLTELAFLLIYGFMLAGAYAATSGGGAPACQTGDVQINGVCRPEKEFCLPGEVFKGGKCQPIPDNSKMTTACYTTQNKSGEYVEHALFKVIEANANAISIRFTTSYADVVERTSIEYKPLENTIIRGATRVMTLEQAKSLNEMASKWERLINNTCRFHYSYKKRSPSINRNFMEDVFKNFYEIQK